MTEQEERDQIAAQLDALIAIAGAFLWTEKFATQPRPLPRHLKRAQPVVETWRKAS